MFRLILYLILIVAIYWFAKRALSLPKRKKPDSLDRGEDLVRDPVCECYIPKSQSFSVAFKGRTLFFCSEECYKKYLASRVLPKS